jgi:hypothetical protein
MTTIAALPFISFGRRMRRPRIESRIGEVSRMSDFWHAFRPRLMHAAVLGLAVGLMDFLRAFSSMLSEPESRSPVLGGGLNIIFVAELGTFVIIAAITWAERVRVAPSRRFFVMVMTVVVSAFVATALKLGWTRMYVGTTQEWVPSEWLALFLYLFWMTCATGALAAAYYEFWERAGRSAARLRDSEIERQEIEQRVVLSRLSVMKARIEPAFLFQSIATVQRLYRGNTDAAEKLLDDLIVYLRAALPQMRGTTSTLGDEIHLAASYLKLHDEAFDGRLQVAFDVPESARELRFPPMVLLPLVEDAVQRACSMSRPVLSLAIAVNVGETSLRVAVSDDCPLTRLDTSTEPALTSQEHSLAAFFGDAARLVRDSAEGGGTRITFEIPHGDNARDHR